MYNHSVPTGMRLKLKFNYEAYTKGNERIHHRIGNEVREKFGHIEPVKLVEKLAAHYDALTNETDSAKALKGVCQQFLVFSFVNLIKLSNIWESPIEKHASPALHIIIADWEDKHLGFCAKALLVEGPGKLSDEQVRSHILNHLKETSPNELYKSYKAASEVFKAPESVN
jgi:hypothetical protein